MLTKGEAEESVLARLKSRFDCEHVSVEEIGDSERPFGWVFFVTAKGASDVKVPNTVIVNKYSGQVVATTIDHEPERIIKLYEKLLAHNQAAGANWCLTLSDPWPWKHWWNRSVERKAKEAGFYEIGRKEKEP
ncbi:MAG TPA: hypothetical protein VHV54_18510 [Candidatus Binatia bacterium]|nr:hypothetical protein [Candidatus Binatia bacterium]